MYLSLRMPKARFGVAVWASLPLLDEGYPSTRKPHPGELLSSDIAEKEVVLLLR
jgi:hypothetical protein